MKQKNSLFDKLGGCGCSIVIFIMVFLVFVLVSVFFGGMIVQYIGIAVGLIVAIITYSKLSKKKTTDPPPVSPDFSWTKSEQQFREIYDVKRNVKYFYIESEHETCQCELIDHLEFRISSQGYYTARMQFVIFDSVFALRHGRPGGDPIEISTTRGMNSAYILDHLYRGLDVEVELSDKGLGYLVVYTDIPGSVNRNTVISHYNSVR